MHDQRTYICRYAVDGRECGLVPESPAVPRSVRWAVVVGLIGDDQDRTGLMDIRAAELTADHLGQTVKINPGDPTVIVGRLVSVRHRMQKASP